LLNLQHQAQRFFKIQLKEESLKFDHLQQLLHARLHPIIIRIGQKSFSGISKSIFGFSILD
jgi:hypothetical protein